MDRVFCSFKDCFLEVGGGAQNERCSLLGGELLGPSNHPKTAEAVSAALTCEGCATEQGPLCTVSS